MDTRELLRKRQFEVLDLASRIGWLSVSVVAYAFWPRAPFRRKYAERLLASLVKRNWINKVEGVTPTAYVITKAARQDYEAFTSAAGNPGHLDPPITPGPTYRHDVRAASALLFLVKQVMGRDYSVWGQQVVFDREIKAYNTNNKASKRPDGILLDQENEGKGYWLEVENSRKTGPNMRKQVAELIDITMANGNGSRWLHTQYGQISPHPTVVLAVPGGYNMDAFRNRVQKQLDFDDRGERATFQFIEDTKDGFKLHPIDKLKAINNSLPDFAGPVEKWD